MPRYFSLITRTYYLANGTKSVIMLPKAQPGRIVELPLKNLVRFRPPQLPSEIKFTLPYAVNTQALVLYVDTLRPQHVRYRLQPQPRG